MIPCPPPQPPKKGLTRNQAIAFYLSRGYHVDRWGHLRKCDGMANIVYRVKISTHAVRKERQIEFNEADGIRHAWVRLRSGYLKNLWIEDGKIGGLTAKGC